LLFDFLVYNEGMENRLPMEVVAGQSSVEYLKEARLGIINEAYDSGMRVKDLEDQPAFWMREGLKARERGETIDKEWLRLVDASGGRDHPDPYVWW